MGSSNRIVLHVHKQSYLYPIVPIHIYDFSDDFRLSLLSESKCHRHFPIRNDEGYKYVVYFFTYGRK